MSSYGANLMIREALYWLGVGLVAGGLWLEAPDGGTLVFLGVAVLFRALIMAMVGHGRPPAPQEPPQ